jgi:Ca2+-binding EF-hand superfamily protein
LTRNLFVSTDQEERDGVLTESEFVAVPPGEVEAAQSDWMQQEKEWKEERQKEFREIIDTDHNGRVTKDELLVSY